MALITSVDYVVEITPSEVDDTQILTNGLAATRLVITLTDPGSGAEGVHLFVYQVEVIDPTETLADDQVKAMFTNVASPNDIEDLPIGAQSTTVGHLFRHNVVDLLLPSYTYANDLKDEILADITALIERNKLLDNPPSEAQQTESGTIS